jgi:hypothetical protein
MKIGTRESLKQHQRKVVEVVLDGEDVAYRLQEMNGTERDQFEVATITLEADGSRKVNALNLRGRLVAACLVDEAGKRFYGVDEVQQISDDLPSSVLGKLFDAAQKLNGLDAAAPETAAKNSDSAPNVDSTSA